MAFPIFTLLGVLLIINVLTASAKPNNQAQPRMPVVYFPVDEPNFQTALNVFYAKQLREAIANDDYDFMIQMLAKLYLSAPDVLADSYQRHHHSKLTADLKSRLSGDFGNLMVALAADPNEFFAQQLHEAIHLSSPDSLELFEDFQCIDLDIIKEIKDVYQKLYQRDFTTDLRGLIGRSAWHQSVPDFQSQQSCSKNRFFYIANRLDQALKESDFRRVTRLILITINELILDEVKSAFQRHSYISLYNAILNKTAGYYQKALLTIITHHDFTKYS